MPNPMVGLIGASLGSSVVQAGAASKAAKATQAGVDASTNLQRDIFNQTTANYAPFLSAGNDALSAYLYEMGLGDKPVFGGTAPTVETITTPGKTVSGAKVSSGGMGRGDYSWNPGGKTTTTPGTTTYKVNDQTFSTLDEATAYAEKNKTGGKEYGGYSMSPMAKYLMEQGVGSIEGSAAAQGGLYSGATLKALEDNRREIVTADTGDYFSKLFGLSNMGLSAAGNQANAGSSYANNVSNLTMAGAQAKANAYTQGANAITGGLTDMAGIYGYFSNPMAAYASPTMGMY